MEYLYKISSILEKTSPKVIMNYITWLFLHDKIGYLSQDFLEIRNQLIASINEAKILIEPRINYCTFITNQEFGLALASEYVKEYFNSSSKTEAENIIKTIFSSFEDLLNSYDWIDKVTKDQAIKKLHYIKRKVAYPYYIFNETEINEKYDKLVVSLNEYFGNNIRIELLYREKMFKKLSKPVDKERWYMFPQTINAMYQFHRNEIVIPAGIIQEPFIYHGDNAPKAISYGSLGSIIGHEITHGFDSLGKKYDHEGNVVRDWWQSSSVLEFNKRALCFQEQYSSYRFLDKDKINGKLTLGENIADNGGVRISLKAFNNYLSESSHKYKSPHNSRFNNHQLFFLSYAQQYCQNARPKLEKLFSLSEVHSPSKFRVNGVVSNMEEFANAFNCKANSSMNPKNKCILW